MNTISGWVRKLIRLYYEAADPTVAELDPHYQSYGRLLGFLEDILHTCSWKSHNTFTNHYLKDITIFQDGLLRVGPIVAAQRVVPPRRF